MIYNYRNFDASQCDPELDCFICLDPMKDTDAVAHEGQGELHPIHRKCAKSAIARIPSCGVCRVAINPGSLLSLQDRCVAVVKPILRDAVIGLGVGILLASPVHVIYSQPTLLKGGIVTYGLYAGLKKVAPVVERGCSPVVRRAVRGAVAGFFRMSVVRMIPRMYQIISGTGTALTLANDCLLFGVASAIGACVLGVDEEG